MPRPIWSGAISFGLVNVPVKLYSAVHQRDVRFHQLHAEDGGRVRYRKVCAIDGKELEADEIVKGYEVSPDRWVTLTAEEIDAAHPENTRRVDIEQFVDLPEIDPIHFERPYYVVPDKGAGKPYALLLEAMEKAGKVAIGRVVMRGKQYFVSLRPKDGMLVMATMLYPDEVVPPEKIEFSEPKGKASEREVKMAEQLIGALSAKFDPEKYQDETRERVLDLIERKSQGETIEVPEVEAPKKTTDLMAALEASLKAMKKHGEGESEAEA